MAINTELTKNNVRINVQHEFDLQIERSDFLGLPKSRTPKPAKSLIEVYGLVKDVIDHYDNRASVPLKNRVIFTEEEPDAAATGEIISFSVIQRLPGAFGGGAPGEAKTKNMKAIYRDSFDDPENPGYRLAVYGYWHDNIIRFTCWAKTNKAANARVEWLENVLDEYMWFFKAEGVDRFLFQERQTDITVNIKGNKWYGRPLDYFIRTETLKTFSEKKMEEILIKVATK